MKVFVAGAGLTKVDEHWDKTLGELMAEAGLQAIEKADVGFVDAVYVANVFAESIQEQVNLAAILAEELGLRGVVSSRVEAGGASGLAAVQAASSALASGLHHSALVVGAEKMSDVTSEEAVSLITMEEQSDVIASLGVSQLAEAALLYKEYLKRYSLEQEDVAIFPVISHENSSTASHAQYQFKINIDSVMNSPFIAEPLRRLETTAPADGAAALLLLSESTGRKNRHVKLSGLGFASDYLSPFDREDPLELRSLALATERALAMARVERSQVNFVELHDNYSFLSPLSLEAMGFAARGEACHLARRNRWSLSGELPINTFGGLKGRGYPVGASGIYALVEAYRQLVNEAGKNQVHPAKIGLVSSIAGLGSYSGVAVLEVVT